MNFTQEFLRRRFAQKKKGKTMAERTERLPQNVVGPYYVDSTCIDCDMCRSTAPDSFRRDEEIGMTIVYRQPVTPEEQALAEDAKQGCPTESIGNDGLMEPKTGSWPAQIQNPQA
jgi:ferredoxin